MLKYLVILLDDTSVSYCHYVNEKNKRNLIALENLKAGIFFAMKENLMIQFIYPNHDLPQEYKEVIHSIDHSKIVPVNLDIQGDVMVVNGLDEFSECIFDKKQTYVLRLEKKDFFENVSQIKNCLAEILRLNVVITDVETFSETDFVFFF